MKLNQTLAAITIVAESLLQSCGPCPTASSRAENAALSLLNNTEGHGPWKVQKISNDADGSDCQLTLAGNSSVEGEVKSIGGSNYPVIRIMETGTQLSGRDSAASYNSTMVILSGKKLARASRNRGFFQGYHDRILNEFNVQAKGMENACSAVSGAYPSPL